MAWAQVNPGDPNYDVMLADPARPEIAVALPEGGLGAVRSARSFAIRLWSDPTRRYTATLRSIAGAADPKAREREIEEELRSMASPFRTAEAFGVEEIIDPRETRPYLCRFVDAAQARLRTTLGPKAKYGVRP